MIYYKVGDIVAECKSLGDEQVAAMLTAEPLTTAGGHRYTEARRPSLYNDSIGEAHESKQVVIWLSSEKTVCKYIKGGKWF